ncbi:MAG: hypothetical protein COA67_05675 [Lutibacter sp.]|nr:MAG: hypothetical protein COA67_05675 [Lutibacter sp.]
MEKVNFKINTMKKTLTLLIIVLGFSFNTFAQLNDATWEETISFLKENMHHLQLRGPNGPGGSFTENSEIDNYYLKTVRSWFEKDSSKDYIQYIHMKLTDLRAASLNKDGNIRLYGKTKLAYNHRPNFEPDNDMHLKCRDSFMKDRILKAFKHLAYLAQEKKGGSKF